jgi:hypothetical protein
MRPQSQDEPPGKRVEPRALGGICEHFAFVAMKLLELDHAHIVRQAGGRAIGTKLEICVRRPL